MKYEITQCFDEWPKARNEAQEGYRAQLKSVYDTINPMTLPERIKYANSESEEIFDLVLFLDLGAFISVYMSELIKLPFGKHHPMFFNIFPRGMRAAKRNVIAPRGFAKTQINAVCYPLHCVVYKDIYKKLGLQADHFIIILSRNYDVAMRRVRDIKAVIELHFKHLVGKSWGEKTTITKNQTLILPEGRGGRIRGALYNTWRPTLIVCDDLDDMDALANPTTARKDTIWFNSDLMECGSHYTNFLNIDTVKSREAFTMKLSESPSWETTFIRAVSNPTDLIHPAAESLWEGYQDIFMDQTVNIKTRMDKTDAYFNRNKHEMIADVDEMWPEHINYRELREKGFDQGIDNVLREYQGYPEDEAGAIFDMRVASMFTADMDKIVKTKGFERDDGRLVKWKDVVGATIFIKWATVDDIKNYRNASICTIVWEPIPKGGYQDSLKSGAYGYVFDAWHDIGGREMQIIALIDAYQTIAGYLAFQGVVHPKYKIVCDAAGFTDAEGRDNFLKHYRAAALSHRIDLIPDFKTMTGDEHERIAALEAPILKGWISFSDSLSADFFRQFEAFPRHADYDMPAACEGAWNAPINENAEIDRLQQEETTNRSSAAYKRRSVWRQLGM